MGAKGTKNTTYLECHSILGDLTIWFIIEDGIPEYEGKVRVRVHGVFIPVLFDAGANVIQATRFWDELESLFSMIKLVRETEKSYLVVFRIFFSVDKIHKYV
jgi:hypothetical protein